MARRGTDGARAALAVLLTLILFVLAYPRFGVALVAYRPSPPHLFLACALLALWGALLSLRPGGGRDRTRAAVLALAAMAALYGPVVARGYFVQESFNQLQIWRLHEPTWPQTLFDHSYEFHGGRYRPVEMALWRVLYGCFGMRPWPYLLAAAALVAVVARATFLCAQGLGVSRGRAAVAALLVAAHPLSFFRAAYLQYATLLVTALGLLAWHAYMRYSGGGGRRDGAAALLLLLAAVFTKESAYLLPLLFLAWAFVAGGGRGAPPRPFAATARRWALFPASVLAAFLLRWRLLCALGAWRPAYPVRWDAPLRGLLIGLPRSLLALCDPTPFGPDCPLAQALWFLLWAGVLVAALYAAGPAARRTAGVCAMYAAAVLAPEYLHMDVGPYSMRYYAALPAFCIALASCIPPGAGRPAAARAGGLAAGLVLSGFAAAVALSASPAFLENAGTARRVTEGMRAFLRGLPPESRSGRAILVRGLSATESENFHDLWIKTLAGRGFEDCLLLPLAAFRGEICTWALIPEGMWDRIWVDPGTERISWRGRGAGCRTLSGMAEGEWRGRIMPRRRGPALLNHEVWAPTPADAARMTVPAAGADWNAGSPVLTGAPGGAGSPPNPPSSQGPARSPAARRRRG